jgi:hypothetical protein
MIRSVANATFRHRLAGLLSHCHNHARTKATSASLKSIGRLKSVPNRVAAQTKSSISLENRTTALELRKLSAAKKLYDAGVRRIYTAPSQTGQLAFTWLIGIFCLFRAGTMSYEGFDKLRDGHGLSWKKRSAIEWSNRLVMVFLAVIGGFAIWRYRGLVKSLDLVQGHNDQFPHVSITTRRLLPFLTQTYHVRLSESLRKSLAAGSASEQSGQPKQTMGGFFGRFKDYFLMDHLHDMRYSRISDGAPKKAQLDINGKLSISQRDFESFTSRIESWN